MSVFHFERLTIGHIHALAENQLVRSLEVMADLYEGELFTLPAEHLTPLVMQFGEELRAHMSERQAADDPLVRRLLGGIQ